VNSTQPKPRLQTLRLAIAGLFLGTAALLSAEYRAEDRPRSVPWEKDIAAFERQDKANSPPKNAILFVGSSSIRLWDLNKSFPGVDLIKRVFGDSQLADSVYYAPRIVLKYAPRMVFLYAGDNDIATGKKPEQVVEDFSTFVRIVHKDLPATRIVFLSIKPSILRWKLVEKMRTANRLIEDICKQDERLLYADVATPLLGNDGKPRPELFRKDGLHLNDQGYEIWASVLRPLLNGPALRPRGSKRASGGSSSATTDRQRVGQLLAEAKALGDARRGAEVFRSPQFACLSCHKVGAQGGTVGPDLTFVGRCLPPGEIVESVLWPKLKVKDGYNAWTILTTNGKLHTGYIERDNQKELTLRDPVKGETIHVPRADIEERKQIGTLMPDGLTAAMSAEQLRDLIRFLMDLGIAGNVSPDALLAHQNEVATFSYDRAPLQPERWPSWQEWVNRDRLYDFYAKETAYFKDHPGAMLLPEFPGLDGTKYGHWGNQNEDTWVDNRWNDTDLGCVMCGVFHGPGIVVPKGVCVRLGERGELAACFNPETLCYEAVWHGGFVRFSAVRHGFLAGRIPVRCPPRPVQSQGWPALRHWHGRLGHVQRRRRQLPAGALHRPACPAPPCPARARERHPYHFCPASRRSPAILWPPRASV
jgi:putative heme-binding domain-containing protein